MTSTRAGAAVPARLTGRAAPSGTALRSNRSGRSSVGERHYCL